MKRAITVFIDDDVAGKRFKFVDHVGAFKLPAYIDVTAPMPLPAAFRGRPALWRPIPQQTRLGAAQKTRVYNEPVASTEGLKQRMMRFDRGPSVRDFQRRATPHKIVLHVDDDQRGSAELILDRSQPYDQPSGNVPIMLMIAKEAAAQIMLRGFYFLSKRATVCWGAECGAAYCHDRS